MILSAGSTIALASSGSRPSISSVEPLISAKSAVTDLRSPSTALAALVSTRMAFLPANGFFTCSDGAVSRSAPQSAQNDLPDCDSAPHSGQIMGSAAPQSAQKRFPDAISDPHLGQRIRLYPLSSSSRALASFRSAVS